MRIGIEQVETEKCFRKFRFRENLYTSTREITIPIMVQPLDGTLIKKEVTVNVINKEEELFSCALWTLVDWKVAVFYDGNKMEFIKQSKRSQ